MCGIASHLEVPKRLTATSNYKRPPGEQFSHVPDYASKFIGDQRT
jgi:hypothetical protein